MNSLLIETILCVKTEGQAALHRAGPPVGKDSVKGMGEGLRLTIGKRNDSATSAIKKEESINKNDVIQELFGFFLPIFTDFSLRFTRHQCGGPRLNKKADLTGQGLRRPACHCEGCSLSQAQASFRIPELGSGRVHRELGCGVMMPFERAIGNCLLQFQGL